MTDWRSEPVGLDASGETILRCPPEVTGSLSSEYGELTLEDLGEPNWPQGIDYDRWMDLWKRS